MPGPYLDTDTYTPTEILASSHGTEQRQTVTIASGIGVLEKGTVLGQYNTGVNSGCYGAYSDADIGTLGLGVAKGILSDKVDATASGVQSTMYTHGNFYEERLIGADANAKSDLKNCVFVHED